MNLNKTFFLFACVGAFGYIVDTGVLYLLKDILGPFIARIPAIFAAILATWLLNRQFTFKGKHSGLSLSHEFFAYFGLMLFGIVANYSAYAISIHESSFIRTHIFIATAIGSIAGMFINFLTTQFILYRKKPLAS